MFLKVTRYISLKQLKIIKFTHVNREDDKKIVQEDNIKTLAWDIMNADNIGNFV